MIATPLKRYSALVLPLASLPQCTATRPDIAPRVFRESVVVLGTGPNATSAIADAHRGALESSLGAFVDIRTRLENDQVFEEILTLSAGYVESTELISQSVQPDGTVRVTARVKLAGNLLKSKVEEATASISAIDGRSLAAQLTSKSEAAKVAQRLVIAHHDRGVPDILTFSTPEIPKVIRQVNDQVWLGITVRATPNTQAIQHYNDYLRGIAQAVSVRQATDASPGAFGLPKGGTANWNPRQNPELSRYLNASRDSTLFSRRTPVELFSLVSWTRQYPPGKAPTLERGLGVVAFRHPAAWFETMATYAMPIDVAAAFAVGAASGGSLTIQLTNANGDVLDSTAIPTTWSLEQVGTTRWTGECTPTMMKDEDGVEWAFFDERRIRGEEWLGLYPGRFITTLGLDGEDAPYFGDYFGEQVFATCFGQLPLWGTDSDSRLMVGDYFDVRIAVPTTVEMLGQIRHVICKQDVARRSHAGLLNSTLKILADIKM